MKLKIPVLLIFFLITSGAFCQENIHKLMGFAGVGLSVPTANREFTKTYRAGINLNLAGGYLFNYIYGVRLDLQYNHFPYKETDPNLDTKFYSYSVIGNFLIGDFGKYITMNPYGLAGPGMFVNSETVSSKESSSSNTVINLGFELGGGVNIVASEKIGMFIELQWIFIFHQGMAKGYMPFKSGVTVRM